MKRLFLSACLAITLNATVAGCAAQQGGTVDYSTALQEAGLFATIVNGVVGVFATAHTTSSPTDPTSTAQISAPASVPVAASAPL